MPLFKVGAASLSALEQTNFTHERLLQRLIEGNLGPVFNCRLVGSEFPTGAQHGGRIDTLALSEDNNPVIIEYKRVESSELVNQALFYLAWMDDHRGDFEIAVQKALGGDAKVDWSDIRVICIAPNYRKYDLHAVQVMGANIELWQYRYFKPSLLYLEEVFTKSYAPLGAGQKAPKSPIAGVPGRKPGSAQRPATYTFEHHLKGKPERIQELALAAQEFVMGLDPAMTETPKKLYIAYKISQNIVCIALYKGHLELNLKLDPKALKNRPPNSRDMSGIGHYGTGDFQIKVRSMEELETAKPFIEMAYRKVGG